MSFQLIYTSSFRLLDSSESGYGIVARSEKLPKALCAKLSALSIYREPRGGCAQQGPQFSYHILDHAAAAWHVLSCVQQAGADYSGRGCYIAHHLILNQSEVRRLADDAEHRPTPAGLTLALLKCGFWMNRWHGEPAYISGEPNMTFDDLPDAAAQPTWKRLTGHKANARAFYTSPFERDCLITIEPGTHSKDILSLFHESDWLTHARGWGVTYTTLADEADSFADTLRMVTVPSSPLVQRAIRTGHPVLNIERCHNILTQDSTRIPPVSNALPPTHEPHHKGSMMSSLARAEAAYIYTEEPDWLVYDVRPAHHSFVPVCVAVAGAAACVALGIWLADDSPDAAQTATGLTHAVGKETGAPPLRTFTALIESEYAHENTITVLDKLLSIAEETPEDALIIESAGIIRNARRNEVRHTAAIKRLCECSRLLGISDKQMVLLYLHEATHKVDPQTWQEQFNGIQLKDWLALKQSEPQILGLMQTPELKPYAIGAAAATPETTILATADTPGYDVSNAADSASVPNRVSLIPSTAVAGAELPQILEEIIPLLPVSIATGTYAVSAFTSGGVLKGAQRLSLSENGYRIYITPTETEGEFLLKPEHKEGNPTDVPAARFTVRGGRLHSVRCEGAEAVVSFPVPTKSDFYTNVILATSFGIPVPSGKAIPLPPVSKVNLEVTPDKLEIVTPSDSQGVAQLRLHKPARFPWVLAKGDVDPIHFSINIPVLSGHNSLALLNPVFGAYEWQESTVVDETEKRTSVLCEMVRKPDLPGRLERMFELVANTPCCGETASDNKELTLGNLYSICCRLGNEKLTRAEKRHLQNSYIKLFADKAFNKILLQIITRETGLYLTPEEATANKFKAIKVRNSIKKQLATPAACELIRKRICDTFTRSLCAAYTTEQQKQKEHKEPAPVLVLKDITIGNHVELLWRFEMKQQQK